MQPYFFPYIGYFQLIDAVDVFRMYELVTFRKRTWITRNRILDKGTKEPVNIQIPVSNKSSFKRINQIQVSEDLKWKNQLLKLIYFNYKKAPFFEEIYNLIEECLSSQSLYLNDYNAFIISEICNYLDIQTLIISKNDSFLDLEEKLPAMVQNPLEIKTKRIIEICKTLNADTYLNPIGGTELYDKKDFRNNNIDLKFIETQPFTYHQFNNTHTPYLSIIDVLMHNSKEKTKSLIKEYKLI